MDYDVIEARHVGGYLIWLRFRDDTAGEINLGPELYGPVFEPLCDPQDLGALARTPVADESCVDELVHRPPFELPRERLGRVIAAC